MTGRERGPLGPGTSGMLESRRISSSTPLKRSGPQPAYNPHKETLRTSWTRLLSRTRLRRVDHAQGSLVKSGSLLSVLTDNPEGLTGLVELDGALAARRDVHRRLQTLVDLAGQAMLGRGRYVGSSWGPPGGRD